MKKETITILIVNCLHGAWAVGVVVVVLGAYLDWWA